MTKLLIHISESLKKKLNYLKKQGYTANGYIRTSLERELGQSTMKKGG